MVFGGCNYRHLSGQRCESIMTRQVLNPSQSPGEGTPVMTCRSSPLPAGGSVFTASKAAASWGHVLSKPRAEALGSKQGQEEERGGPQAEGEKAQLRGALESETAFEG